MVWALFAVYGIYFGCTEGVEKAMVADLVAPEKRGTAFGFYNLVIGLGALPASLLLGFLWQRYSAEFALLTSAMISLIAVVLFALFVTVQRPGIERSGG
jgi:predicted MFS family arabinose efflux permease